ncbi:MAG: YcbK family protein [Deltaproteobacteria bacterium]|nr:YcbK family protein [Deltaproteobacteria bacterium]
MRLRWYPLLTALAIALVAPMGSWIPEATASPPRQAVKNVKRRPFVSKTSGKRAKGQLICKGKGKHRRCRRAVRRFFGQSVPAADLRTEPLPRPSGWVILFSNNFKEEVRVNIYNPDGSYDFSALAQLDRLFRCRRTKEERAVDPRLYEILSILHDQFGGRRVLLTSGFRFQRNEGSRHFHASAMDIVVEGVSYRELFQFAKTLDLGGMGIGQYPRAGFVHIDFRAPGEPSYRWTDTSGPGTSSTGRLPSRMWRRSSRPNS